MPEQEIDLIKRMEEEDLIMKIQKKLNYPTTYKSFNLNTTKTEEVQSKYGYGGKTKIIKCDWTLKELRQLKEHGLKLHPKGKLVGGNNHFSAVCVLRKNI